MKTAAMEAVGAEAVAVNTSKDKCKLYIVWSIFW